MLHIVKSLEKLKLYRYLQQEDVFLLWWKMPFMQPVSIVSISSKLHRQIWYLFWKGSSGERVVEKTAENIQIINKFEFVELTVSHAKSISW